MKFFIAIAFVAFAATAFAASPAANKAEESEAQNVAQAQAAAPTDLTRMRKSAYGGSSGGASIPAPHCAKNYLFSCQPNLAPVPCSSPQASSYGSQGAYSVPVPAYTVPIRGNYGYQQAYARSFIPQALNYKQFYQY